MTLPDQFIMRMQALLGAEAEALLAALNQPPLAGLRVNPLKLSSEQLSALVNWSLEPVPWCPAGFIVPESVQPGKHPYHAAGLYYLQEPSAMAVAEALAPAPGELVLDLAAAPGGKATHLAALIGDQGLLVANELERSRTAALASNLERWGVRNALITNASAERLAERWGACFHRVLVDAPCSGEGMFRKSTTARQEWSAKTVQGCSVRQQRLLATAADLVRPGGMLAYSTCTFAPEEDEQVVAQFLAQHPNFELRAITLPQADPGRADWVAADLTRTELALTARFWPHRVPGEGHFVALLQRVAGDVVDLPTAMLERVPRAACAAWQSFVAATLTHDPAEGMHLISRGSQIYALPADLPPVAGLSVVRAGLWLGTLQRDRFIPAHSLALALPATGVQQRFELAPDDPRLVRYLQGHPLPEPGLAGWLLLTVSGFPLSWGRRAQGIIKNAYPKGLRRPLRE
jgi:NOL1/NOP2/sun family putative RNA methylase